MKSFPFFLVLFLAVNCFSAEYYVDSQAGSDAWDGKSEKTAWKTVRRVNSQELLPGDTVKFRAGGVWRESLLCQDGEEGKPVTYTSYGEGEKPVFMASVDLADPSVWTSFGKNIWVTPEDAIGDALAERPDFGHGTWYVYSENKGKATLKNSRTPDGKTLLTVTCQKGSERSCDIQLNNARFPVAPGEYIRFRFRARASVPFEAKSISFMMAGHPWSSYGNVIRRATRFTTEWQDCEIVLQTTVEQLKQDGRLSFFLGGDIPEGCELSIVPLGAESVGYRSLGLDADVGNILLVKRGEKSETVGWKRWSVEDLKAPGDFYHDAATRRLYFYSSENPAKVYSTMEAAKRKTIFAIGGHQYVILDGLHATLTGGHGANGANIRHCAIRNCAFTWIGGSHLYTRNGKPVRYGNGVELWCACEDVIIENNYFSEVYDTAMTNQGPDTCVVKNIIWRGNVCENCEQCYEIWLTSKETRVENLVFEGNRCVDSGFGWSHEQRPDKRGTHLLSYGLNAGFLDIHYRNNDFGRTKDAMLWFFNPRVSEFQIDHNTYHMTVAESRERPLFYWAQEAPKGVTFEKYRELTGNDKNSEFAVSH